MSDRRPWRREAVVCGSVKNFRDRAPERLFVDRRPSTAQGQRLWPPRFPRNEPWGLAHRRWPDGIRPLGL